MGRIRTSTNIMPTRAPTAKAPSEERLAYATSLSAAELRNFASSFSFQCGGASRVALEEQVLQSIGEWTDRDVRQVLNDVQDFVHRKMMPDSVREPITRESVLVHLGVSEETALFPCPSEIGTVENPVHRATVSQAVQMIQSKQYICLHGEAGVGKTTALQQIEAGLPDGSIMLKYDCYGAGRYLDSSALRHRTRDAFLQMTNELAVRLKLPLFLLPRPETDYPRQFMLRLRHAADTLRSRHAESLIIVAIDAADNAIVASEERQPAEAAFVHDFVQLMELPANVRFVISMRTGRRDSVELPARYRQIRIPPFSLQETGEYARRAWAATPSWVEDFHDLSSGVPRVQAEAFRAARDTPIAAINRLMPNGRSLGDIFRERFDEARAKGGTKGSLSRICAGLIALPRPVPLTALASVLEEPESEVLDVCRDLAPSIRYKDGLIGFADEDLEYFIRDAGTKDLPDIRHRVARWMLSSKDQDPYAAANVAGTLLVADLRSELLRLADTEPSPPANVLPDPVLRREVELQRLRLAIQVCREAEDVPQALRFVLKGAESIQTEGALRGLLTENPDLAVRFAEDSVRRIVLSDPSCIEDHGAFLFHRLAVDGSAGDAISARHGKRKLDAWLEARRWHREDSGGHLHRWKVEIAEVSCMVEAAFKLGGPDDALKSLAAWSRRRVKVEVGLSLPWQLIAEGRAAELDVLASDHLRAAESLFILVPLALSGWRVDIGRLADGLRPLLRRKLCWGGVADESGGGLSLSGRVLELMLAATEILAAKGAFSKLVDYALTSILDCGLSQIEEHSPHELRKLDVLLRAYTLREVLHDRPPKIENMFVRRQKVERADRKSKSDDPPAVAIAKTAIGVYGAVATALVSGSREKELEKAIVHFSGKNWILSHHRGAGLKGHIAAHLSSLLVAGHDSETVWRLALQVHGDWRGGWLAPNEAFLARFRLRPELHAPMIGRIFDAAQRTREARTAAQKKTDLLSRYARALLPISESDATAIFDLAVDVVGELDDEVIEQIRLLNRLVQLCRAESFACARSTATQLRNIVTDAAVRLEGYDHFPWDAAANALERLDLPAALADVARWHDENVVQIWETLPAVLRSGLADGAMRPEQASALSLFLDDDNGGVVARVLEGAPEESSTLAEEAAYDVVVRGYGKAKDVMSRMDDGFGGRWIGALGRQEAFLAPLLAKSDAARIGEGEARTNRHRPVDRVWRREELTDSVKLTQVVNELRDEETPPLTRDVLESARQHVAPSDRVVYLDALAGTTISDSVAEAILETVDGWRADSPSVSQWCRKKLPNVIVSRFREFTRFLPYEGRLSAALDRTELSHDERSQLVLRGLEGTVDGLRSTAIFAVVGVAARDLAEGDTVKLVECYGGRLAGRIPSELADQMVSLGTLPASVDEAVARFIFASLGDCDSRIRWRAAHAVRRLARAGDRATLRALAGEYYRREDSAFRARGHVFYWSAARLWFVMAFAGMTNDRPAVASDVAGELLLEIALDDSFPHLLVRSFARDACEKLAMLGHLTLSNKELEKLTNVNESRLPQSREETRRGPIGRGFPPFASGRRFQFNSMDTLPYWYQPKLRMFSNLDGDEFLDEVERWIFDEWGHDDDVSKSEERDRIHSWGNWALGNTRHGSIPTIERLSSHLEWHAMWCALGSFLAKKPLIDAKVGFADLKGEISSKKLISPPIWSADIAGPVPLEKRQWEPDAESVESWLHGVEEDVHRGALLPTDFSDYVVVDGWWSRRMNDRIESTRISSALATPATMPALLRALATMEDSWDYKLPAEGEEDAEIDWPYHQMLGWLHLWDYGEGSGIDGKDPFRVYGFGICSQPGQDVVQSCGLKERFGEGVRWVNDAMGKAMFLYQAWGKPDEEEERYYRPLVVAGYRLLAHKEQLRAFLGEKDMNLVVEIEISRRDREVRSFDDEEGRIKVVQLYGLRAGGILEDARGRLGTWAGNSRGA